MALDFPNTPSLNQTFTGPNGTIWMWDGVKWVAITSTSTYAGAGNVGRNLIHNPLFNVAQRGVGPFTTPGYSADRWSAFLANGSFNITIAAFTDAARAQVGDEAAAFAFINNVVGSATVGSYCFVSQLIEGVRRLTNKTVTVSFWAAASAGTPKFGVSVDQYFGAGGSPSATVNGNGQSVNLSTTWTRYSMTFTLPSVSGKTLGTSNNDCTYLNFWYSAEATFATRSGSVGVQTANIQLWGVQLEIGSVATPLEKPDPRYDLANCQRFYQGNCYFGLGCAANAGGQGMFVYTPLLVSMRATPTVVVTVSGTATNVSSQTVVSSGPSYVTVSSLSIAAGACVWTGQYSASADL